MSGRVIRPCLLLIWIVLSSLQVNGIIHTTDSNLIMIGITLILYAQSVD